MDDIRFERSVKVDKLGKMQQPILDAVSRALPGAAPAYAVLPFGNVALIVIWPGFENRDEPARENLVRDALLASLRINVSDYISGIHCWTPREADDIENAGDGSMQQPPTS